MNTHTLDLDAFVTAYAIAALWSSTDDNGDPIDDACSVDDIDPETLAGMRSDCSDFITSNGADVALAMQRPGYGIESAGHDFWLTRNHHGAGFWDRGLGEVGERLTKAAHVYGSVDLWVTEEGAVSAS